MKSRAILYTLLAAAILVAIAGFVSDVKNTARYGGVDLRNRVTAARVAQELKQDPYFYKWSPTQSDRYLDPSDNTAIPVARVTVPPTVLLFHNLISALPYQTQRWIWFFFQWALFLGTVYLLTRRTETHYEKITIWILALLFIAGSQFFRLHVERGQIYLLYIFLFALALDLFAREKTTASALVLGYLISLRAPFVFAIVPFLLYKKYKFVSFVAAGALASVLITGLFFPFTLWKSYEQSAAFQGAMRANPATNFSSPGVDVAEGMNIREFLGVPGEDSSLQRIIHAATGTWLDGAALALLLVITTALLAFFAHRFHPSLSGGTNNLFLAGIIFTMLAELFIPAPRWPYADVIWLIPLALLVAKLKTAPRGTVRSTVLGLALTGLFLNTGVHGIARLTLLGEGLFIASLLVELMLPNAEHEEAQANIAQA
ncbi:MAG: DUF2029 domain-containing protein [Candidatus Harrisonbacteria bacterium]|nr:DUF2029 domain-containing protein [Candidatus Harrisonbacteria bacterium]